MKFFFSQKKAVFKEYLPDMLVQLGIFWISIVLIRKWCSLTFLGGPYDCGPNWSVIIPVILISLGINVGVRRFLNKKSV